MSDDSGLLGVCLVGPLPPPLGGTTVAFKSLLDDLSSRPGVRVTAVNTLGVRGSGLRAPAALLRLAREVERAAQNADVVALHASTTALHLTVPIAVRASSRRGLPLIVRKFDGRDFMEYGPLRRGVILSALSKADLYLAETKMLVSAGRSAGLPDVRWFPNSREMPDLSRPLGRSGKERGAASCRRFVYLGQLRRGKGIREIVRAGEGTRDPVEIDVYGTLGYDIDASEFEGLGRVRYLGALDPSDVLDVLSEYDCMLLPSYCVSEGYPGVILEAYGAGIPVIATRWGAIPEIVDERTGVFVEPRDPEALRAAMLSLVESPSRYRELLEGVRERRMEFSRGLWHERFVDFCREVSERRDRSGAGDGA
ncbi:MAG: glycosyltransferase [Candidatus Eisenbacteria bacterium]|nr:glycosyltransferase [Candidatus Eisenbacteria bacterium]